MQPTPPPRSASPRFPLVLVLDLRALDGIVRLLRRLLGTFLLHRRLSSRILLGRFCSALALRNSSSARLSARAPRARVPSRHPLRPHIAHRALAFSRHLRRQRHDLIFKQNLGGFLLQRRVRIRPEPASASSRLLPAPVPRPRPRRRVSTLIRRRRRLPAALTPFTPFPPFTSVFFTLRFVSAPPPTSPSSTPRLSWPRARDAADPAAAAAASPTSETSLPFVVDDDDDVRPRPRSPA